MKVPDLIRNRRKELGLTLEDVALATGVSISTARKWEVGIVANMKKDKIVGLAKVLQIDPAYLIDTDSDEETIRWNLRLTTAYEAAPEYVQRTICDMLHLEYKPRGKEDDHGGN